MHNFIFREVFVIGLLPTLSTANAAPQTDAAAAIIIFSELDKPTAIIESKQSPAPETSRGFVDRAGKD